MRWPGYSKEDRTLTTTTKGKLMLTFLAMVFTSARLKCWIYGHTDMVTRIGARMACRCFYCGRETVGWTIERKRTT